MEGLINAIQVSQSVFLLFSFFFKGLTPNTYWEMCHKCVYSTNIAVNTRHGDGISYTITKNNIINRVNWAVMAALVCLFLECLFLFPSMSWPTFWLNCVKIGGKLEALNNNKGLHPITFHLQYFL